MKFMIQTGNESHTSSYAHLQAKYVGGEFDGQFLYQVKVRQISAEWDKSKHHQWVTTVFDIPEGQQILIEGKSYGDDIKRVYRLDSTAEIVEDYLCRLQGCDRGQFKGRMVLVRDLLKEADVNLKASQTEGF